MKTLTRLILLTALSLSCACAFGQVNVQKVSGTNAITGNLSFPTGKALTIDSGATLTVNGIFITGGAGTNSFSGPLVFTDGNDTLPVGPSLGYYGAGNQIFISGGDGGILIQNQAQTNTNLSISDVGNAVLRGTLTSSGTSTTSFAGPLIFADGNDTFPTGPSIGYYGTGNQIFLAGGDGGFLIQNQAQNATNLGITDAGAATFRSLAGTGSRAVVADANGLLSAPVSDETMKDPLRDLPDSYGLEMVMRLRPTIYSYKDKSRFGEKDYLGFGARATAEILPEVTGQMKDGTYYMSKEDIVPVLVKAIQQLEAQMNELRQRN